MARLLVTSEDLGTGLKVENNKVVVDVEALSLPVDVHIEGATYDETAGELELTFTGTQTPIRVQLAEALGVNTKTKTITTQGENSPNIVITDTDDNTFTVDLTPAVTHIIGQNVPAQIKAEVKKAIGEEVQSLGGVKLGYLMTAQANTLFAPTA